MRLNTIKINKYRLIIFLIVAFLSAVSLLAFLDYFNLESIQLLNQRGFYFEYTWKGRMFLLMFSLLFVFESVLNWQKLGSLDQQEPRDHFKILFAVVFALLPIAYIIGINFLNLNQAVMSVGEALRAEIEAHAGSRRQFDTEVAAVQRQ